MAVLADIDEAGYGPILGPLVVSACAFEIPDSVLKGDLWQVLKKSVSKQKKHRAGRLLICDSKKAFNRKTGTGHLERTVLACLKSLRKSPDSFNDLIGVLCPEIVSRLEDYPWYKNCRQSYKKCDDADIRIASNVFSNDMSQNNISLLAMQSCCIDVAHYNRLVETVNNKASVLFSAICSLIKSIWDANTDVNIQVIIDRQGGRTHYRNIIQKMFSRLDLTIITESENMSSYQLSDSEKSMKLHFVTKADQKYLPVSLSSIVSKYIRELFVERINEYFLNHKPQIKPTAGYWKDGLRFIEDLKTHIPNVKYEPAQLIRSR